MEFYYHIDEVRLGIAVTELLKKVRQQKEQETDRVEFDNGFFKVTEGGKYNIYENGRRILNADSWTEDMIGTHRIADAVLDALRAAGHLTFYMTQDFTDRIDKSPAQAERILYDVYKAGNDTDDRHAFENFVKFFGKNYSRTAYLFFLKDREKYLPIRPEMFKKKFAQLNIRTDCCNGCTWEHYLEFVQIIRDIQGRIQPEFRRPVSLLDAHSFVWCMYLLDDVLKGAENDFSDYSGGKVQITEEQWKGLLSDQALFSRDQLDLLGRFYLADNHAATCKDLSREDDGKYLKYYTSVEAMGRKAAEQLQIQDMDSDDKQEHFWPVFFLGRRLYGGVVEWQMRPELAAAYEKLCGDIIISIRDRMEQKEAETDDNDVLLEKARSRSEAPAPAPRRITITQRYRDPFVSEWAKRRAEGTCLLCGEEAPFLDKNGRPYLETHHIQWLSEGGKDSIDNIAALCPNCHRMMHELKGTQEETESRKFLKDCVADYLKRENVAIDG